MRIMKKSMFVIMFISSFGLLAVAQEPNRNPREVTTVNSDYFLDEKFGIRLLSDAYKDDDKLKLIDQELDALSKRVECR